MTIKTSKGKSFNAKWFGETLNHSDVFGEIISPLGLVHLSDIIDDFEDLEYIDRYDKNEGDIHLEIKPELRSISWTDRKTIQLGFWGKQA